MSNTIVPPFPLARGPPAFKPLVTLSRPGHPTATKARTKKNRNARARTVCEYGTVDAFLSALSEQCAAVLLLAPAYRLVGRSIQAGTLLSGHRPDETSCFHTCIVLDMEAVLVGERSRITYSYRQVRKRMSDLQQKLLAALHHAVQHGMRVTRLHYPAWYQVLAIWVWKTQVRLPDTQSPDLRGHWIAASDAPELPS